jgi:two-component system phosphate regulon sensor histidine kinase PhoR
MNPGLWREIRILAGIALASLVLGAMTGRYFIIAAVGFGLYIATHLRHLYGLQRWLEDQSAHDVPQGGGLWGDVFDQIRRLMKQAGRRQDQLTGMVERFQSAASAMPDAVVILSQDDEIEWANPSARHLFGVDFPGDTGLRLSNLVRDPDFADYLINSDYAEPLEMRSPADSEISLSLQIIPFGSRQKLVLARDITRLMRLEQVRRTFVANVSHELRTPLTVLAGYVETLHEMDSPGATDLRRHLATMREQTIRMKQLVDDLLTLSRLETSPPPRAEETVDVALLATRLKEQAEMLGGHQHTITITADPHVKLRGSRDELVSAFSNLVNNAVRYTAPGGTIRISWQPDNQGATFSVTDTGEGIAPEHIPHLTERFYRVDTARSRASGGTGLGLSIVKHVLLRHQARLGVTSEIGKGSSFRCVFPGTRIVRDTA